VNVDIKANPEEGSEEIGRDLDELALYLQRLFGFSLTWSARIHVRYETTTWLNQKRNMELEGTLKGVTGVSSLDSPEGNAFAKYFEERYFIRGKEDSIELHNVKLKSSRRGEPGSWKVSRIQRGCLSGCHSMWISRSELLKLMATDENVTTRKPLFFDFGPSALVPNNCCNVGPDSFCCACSCCPTEDRRRACVEKNCERCSQSSQECARGCFCIDGNCCEITKSCGPFSGCAKCGVTVFRIFDLALGWTSTIAAAVSGFIIWLAVAVSTTADALVYAGSLDTINPGSRTYVAMTLVIALSFHNVIWLLASTNSLIRIIVDGDLIYVRNRNGNAKRPGTVVKGFSSLLRTVAFTTILVVSYLATSSANQFYVTYVSIIVMLGMFTILLSNVDYIASLIIGSELVFEAAGGAAESLHERTAGSSYTAFYALLRFSRFLWAPLSCCMLYLVMGLAYFLQHLTFPFLWLVRLLSEDKARLGSALSLNLQKSILSQVVKWLISEPKELLERWGSMPEWSRLKCSVDSLFLFWLWVIPLTVSLGISAPQSSNTFFLTFHVMSLLYTPWIAANLDARFLIRNSKATCCGRRWNKTNLFRTGLVLLLFLGVIIASLVSTRPGYYFIMIGLLMLSTVFTGSQTLRANYLGWAVIAIYFFVLIGLLWASSEFLSEGYKAGSLDGDDGAASAQVEPTAVGLLSAQQTIGAIPVQYKYEICPRTWLGINVLDFGFLSALAYSIPQQLPVAEIQEQVDANFANSTFDFEVVYAQQDRSPYFFHIRDAQLGLSLISACGTAVRNDYLEDFQIWNEIVVLDVASMLLPVNAWWPHALTSGYVWFVSLALNTRLSYVDDISEYITALGNETVIVTGHSLGGGVAAMVGAKTKHISVAFSPPGTMHLNEKYDFSIESLRATATTIYAEGDLVPWVDEYQGLQQSIDCDLQQGWVRCHHILTTICELRASCPLLKSWYADQMCRT